MQDRDKPSSLKRNVRSESSISSVKNDRAEADALFLSIGEGAIVIDSDGKIGRINKAAQEILGVKGKDVLGRWYPSVVVLEDEEGNIIPNSERPLAESLISNKPVFRKVFTRRGDGTRIALALTVSPVIHEDKPTGAIEVFRDVTEEVRLDQAKTEFIALASHQLRTPATAVKQYLHMLLDGFAGPLTESQRTFISTANQGNERQLRIINDILKVAAADSGDMVLAYQNADLNKLITSVVEEQQPKAIKNRQALIFTSPAEPVIARVDVDIFRMVIENLIDNAHKYTYPDKTIEVSLIPRQSSTVISIRDEGIGISHTDLRRLFQKFVRLESPLAVAAGGTGLGLYWVKKVLELHGATITVESEIGKGTTFSIILPKQD